uniref:Ornithine decarboxylase 2 n=1 Tax=Drosophila melanogaster TaxID=7227 RepID=DCOR2_DROME|nr:ornithine decarboxylase 2 [Drosophila melanogaster]P40808.2 RecName: Full=Ornithine decarboxylase 2; Short=ODC; AltName: Full=dODC2 [Drosophila melanogaster]AAF59149.2 ornithine decarboxylase 2 [Drosophila melanogaster]|eukprot:NP_477053.2 ornithine decarboxylase 2 [Drosophila melanogaster]
MVNGDLRIQYYDEELNIRKVIEQADLEHLDQALNICDLSSLERKLRLWHKLMPRIEPHYAVKCNDDPVVVKFLADLGTGFDCASKNELKLVLGLGVSPERIIFAHPCRPASHLRYAKEQQVVNGTVDNEYEIYKLRKHYPDSNLIVRFKSEAKKALCPLGDKYGCDAEADAAALMLLAKALGLKVTGTSFHVGSGCSEVEAYDRAIEKAENIFKVGEMIGHKMELLDVGGGFPGIDDEMFEEIAQSVNTSVELRFPDKRIRIISEPGRFFVEAAYTLICKVHAKREVRSKDGKLDTMMYYLNDGIFGAFAGMFYYPEEVAPELYLDEAESLPKLKSVIWGPSCDAMDKISDLLLPNLNPGDLLGFRNMGAYTMPIASPFNGFDVPETRFFKAK